MSDTDIARTDRKRPIQEIAARLGVPREQLIPRGDADAMTEKVF